MGGRDKGVGRTLTDRVNSSAELSHSELDYDGGWRRPLLWEVWGPHGHSVFEEGRRLAN